ncbi:MAG: hypothetical protein OXF06_10190 [Bacteroidetes bacterium]|nr:hypothetical protein [Bacteroidota bacterium]MCY4225191.1 hypothetical protein [Bacteroidota bacterium]
MPSKIQSILIGGLLAAVIGVFIAVASEVSGASDPGNSSSALGIVFQLLGCMAAMTSGLIAVWHYTNENELTLTGGQGVGVGVLAGLVYAVGILILSYVLVGIGLLPSPEESFERIRDSGAFDAPGAEQAESITRMMLTWGIPIITTVIGVIMGLIGGAIGAAVFKRGADDEMSE